MCIHIHMFVYVFFLCFFCTLPLWIGIQLFSAWLNNCWSKSIKVQSVIGLLFTHQFPPTFFFFKNSNLVAFVSDCLGLQNLSFNFHYYHFFTILSLLSFLASHSFLLNIIFLHFDSCFTDDIWVLSYLNIYKFSSENLHIIFTLSWMLKWT